MRREWIGEGLRFACTQCGRCCSAPGYVWVDREEAEAIAARLGLSLEAFGRRYLRRAEGWTSLVEKPDGRCIFLGDDRRCEIYDARPRQCRTFPFWRPHVASREAWAELAQECPGVDHGPLHTREEIERTLGPGS